MSLGSDILKTRYTVIPLRIFIATAAIAANLAAQPPATSLGAVIASQFDRHDGRVENGAVTLYLQDLADGISGSASAQRREIRLTLSPRQYAMLLPGNVLYLSAGMVLMTRNESELAALLAHEQFHAPSLDDKSVLLPSCILSSELMPLGMGRALSDSEARANVQALNALGTAGYDPSSLFTLISRLASQQPVWKTSLSAEHFQSNLPVPPGGYIVDTSRYLALRESLLDLMRPPRSRSPSLLRD